MDSGPGGRITLNLGGGDIFHPIGNDGYRCILSGEGEREAQEGES